MLALPKWMCPLLGVSECTNSDVSVAGVGVAGKPEK